jgi:hypothetical protein
MTNYGFDMKITIVNACCQVNVSKTKDTFMIYAFERRI